MRFCMALWRIHNNTGAEVMIKDCWHNSDEENCKQDECISRHPYEDDTDSLPLYFCCCAGDSCNKDFKYIPQNITEVIPSKCGFVNFVSFFQTNNGKDCHDLINNMVKTVMI